MRKRTSWRAALAVAFLSIFGVLSSAAPAHAPPPSFLVDQQIAKGLGPFVGNGVYNTTGVGQTRLVGLHPGDRGSFDISTENDGTVDDSFFVFGCTGTSRIRLKYLTLGSGPGLVNITAAVESGLYQTDAVPSGGTVAEFLHVKVSRTAHSGVLYSCVVSATSVGSSSSTDAVLAEIKVR